MHLRLPVTFYTFLTYGWPRLHDFWFFGYLKDAVYRDGVPASLLELRTKIETVINGIISDVLQRVVINFDERVDACLAMRDHTRHL